MSLLDDLRTAAGALDPQFQPSANEVQGVLAALVYYVDHGDEFLKAAEQGVGGVTKLVAPAPPEQPAGEVAGPAAPAAEPPVVEPAPATGPPGPADPSTPGPVDPAAATVTDDELDRQIADLEAQRATRQATAQQTVVEHQTGAGETERY